jgi:methylated-DNA-[protein]-cysteine S-methyltransferase
MAERSWTTIGTPVGHVSVACSGTGVTAVRFGSPPQQADGSAGGLAGGSAHDQAGPAATARHSAAASLSAAAGLQLAEYFSGQRRAFELPLDWTAASRLQLHVLGELFDSVAFGETITYGRLAGLAASRADGVAVSARAIGQLMGSNPIPIIVPCHRVVAADGLGGYSGGTGIEIKRWLLIFEGAVPPTLDWTPAGTSHLDGPAGQQDR